MRSFNRLVVFASALGVLSALPAVAHESDLATPGRMGPIVNGETSIGVMKAMFGEPTSRDVLRVGCSRVIKLRWHGEVQTYTYKADDARKIIDIKILERTVRAREENRTYSFHTGKGLRVGDSEERVQDLYPRRNGITHGGHTHYLLRESRAGTKLLAKVVDGDVVQLESAPYEYC
jgi:hypothetical protein